MSEPARTTTGLDPDTVDLDLRRLARTRAIRVLVPTAIGSLVAVGLGVYGRLHEPTLAAVNLAGFSSGVAAKAWLASAAFVLCLVQLVSSLIMYGKIPVPSPSWIGGLHRWSGRLAVLVTVPVALHCLWALGFDAATPRVLVHSLLGCFFYGAFVAKMLLLSRGGAPRWALPVIGGLVFSALTGLWLTSSLWFFTTSGLTF
ncbi:DUF6529 family protein [Pseudonocardia ailaonensis]|uniref:DUF6529 family protein n=1 Tax=Pseudonocardia ailaonensis TaxID=367279 RepID=A0ABN2N1X9_9PSEU